MRSRTMADGDVIRQYKKRWAIALLFVIGLFSLRPIYSVSAITLTLCSVVTY